MKESALPTEVPVKLLAQALLDLRAARGNSSATREAMLCYFKSGIAMGLELGPLVEWLFNWPNLNESAFAQAGYTPAEGIKVLDMVKKIPIREIGLDDKNVEAQNSIPNKIA